LLLVFQLEREWEIPQEWSGTVERKKVDPTPSLSRYRYSVFFRTGEGKRKKLRMGKADSDLYQEGCNEPGVCPKGASGCAVPVYNASRIEAQTFQSTYHLLSAADRGHAGRRVGARIRRLTCEEAA
jgi:hypothetical protein